VKPGISLRAAVLMVVVAIPPLVVVGLVGLERNREALELNADTLHTMLAERLRDELGRDLLSAETELGRTATEVLSDGDEALVLASVGHRLDASDAPFAFVTVYGADGVRRGSVRRGGTQDEGPARLDAALQKEPSARSLPVRRGESLVLPMAVARVDLSGARTFVYAEAQLSPFLERLAAAAQRPPFRRGSAVSVVNADRLVVATGDGLSDGRPSPLFQSLGGDFTFTQDTLIATRFEDEGEPRLGALATLPSMGWAVVVQRPADEAFESLVGLRRVLGGVLALAALLILVAAVLAARWLSRPLERLVQATVSLASRTFSTVDAAVSSRTDEVGALGRAFDAMAVSLTRSEAQVVAETRTRAALSRFLPEDLVERAIRTPEALSPGGERRFVTILFADIVGFTPLSEALPPETIVALLNEYFSVATEIIHARRGLVDKFIGDAVMAVWGLPEAADDDAARAVAAAEDLRRWLESGNRRWRQKWGVELQLAIGLHSGFVVAGNIGSDRRMDYTVIGDAVNVAARLESTAGPGQILVSEATRAQLGDESGASLRNVGAQVLRGRSNTTQIFEVSP
jgi:adenylate cyclase